ncbi:hypothetical protein V2J09_003117 [Rumex salicifolius]
MNGYQLNGRTYGYEKSVSGCLGRVANLFDFKSSLIKSKLLTEKPHHDGSDLARSFSTMSRPIAKKFGDKLIVSEMNRSSFSRKSEGTIGKMLITQEMKKDLESGDDSPNVIAKLMGLDALDVLFGRHPISLPTESKHITVLKPSKMVYNSKLPASGDELSTQPTRIVVLKPTNSHEPRDESVLSYGDKSVEHYSSSSVAREAKKRLSERWACVEQRHDVLRSPSTSLGEMLSLSGVNTQPSGKSLPVEGFNRENSMGEPIKRVARSSFRGKVASLFFQRNKKPCKGEIDKSQSQVEKDNCSTIQSQQLSWSTLKSSTTRGTSVENQDQPSPIRVLEPTFEETQLPSFSDGRSSLIDKSPPIASIARSLSWDEPTTSVSTGGSDEEGTWLSMVQSLLSAADIKKWHSLDSPLDPLLREKYVNLISKEQFYEANRRQLRSNCWLVFDFVNSTLVDVIGMSSFAGREKRTLPSDLQVDRVWGRVKHWFLSRDWEVEGGGDDSRVAAERVVKKELDGRGWDDLLRIEIDIISKEIEGRLLKELVEESVGEWTGKIAMK